MLSAYQYALAVILVINAANGLKCYNCNSEDSSSCKWGFASFTTEECGSAGFIDKLISPKCYKLSAQKKNGKERIARGCLPPLIIGCSAMAKAVGWISSEISDDGESFENQSCETCETDHCNSANRVVSFTFIGLFLSAIAFLF